MSRIPAAFLTELQSRLNIVDIVSEHIRLKKNGANYGACCPFHDEKTPSFTVSEVKQFYHCFGCGAHGDAIQFLVQYQQISFMEAVEVLAQRAGLPVPQVQQVDPQEDSAQKKTQKHAYHALTKAADFYHSQVSHVGAYLGKRRIEESTQKTFLLGASLDRWDGLLSHIGQTQPAIAAMLDTGLIIKHRSGRYYDRFRDRLMFPIRDRKGQVVGFGGRILAEGTPKYLNSPETPYFHKSYCLYGLYEAKQARWRGEYALLVEGYMDVIALHQAGFIGAMATLGTAVTEGHLKLLFRETQDIYCCFDADGAGRKAAWATCQTALPLMEDGRQMHFIFLPEGSDPDTFIMEKGKGAFESLRKQAYPLSRYLFDTLTERLPRQTIDGRARFAKEAKPLLEKLPDGLFKTMMENKLARLVDAPRRWQKKSLPRESIERTTPPPTLPPAYSIISLLKQSPELHQVVGELSWLGSISAPGMPALVSLIAYLKENPSASLQEIEAAGGSVIASVPMLSTHKNLSPDALKAELLGAVKQLVRLGKQQLMEKLLQKAQTPEGLSTPEKEQLKQLVNGLQCEE